MNQVYREQANELHEKFAAASSTMRLTVWPHGEANGFFERYH
jgi:hypothetical protein